MLDTARCPRGRVPAWHDGSVRSRWVSRIIGGVVLLVALLVGGTAVRVWLVGRADDRSHVDAIVVLGSTQADGVPRPVLRSRLEHAKRLYQQHVAPAIITAGGKPGAYTEAQAGKRYLSKHGVPESALVPVNVGHNTLASIVATAREMRTKHWSSAVMVSDPWHSLRARTMARESGIDASVSPTHSGPVVQRRSTELRYIGRETLALLYYRLTGTDEVAAG